MKSLLCSVALAIVYFFAAKFGLTLAFVQSNASPVWPPTGIALAAVLVLGTGVWPGVFIGAFFANLFTQGSIVTSLAIASGNTLEAVVGAMLIQRFAAGRHAFAKPRSILIYLSLAAVLSTMISATIGVTSLTIGGYSSWNNYFPVWLTWWLGDLSSNLIVAPFLIVWSSGTGAISNRRAAEALALAASALIVFLVVFTGFLNKGRFPLQFLTLPLLLWAAFRFRERGTTLFMLCLSAMAVYETAKGFGPMSLFPPNAALLILQGFLATISISGLLVAAMINKQKEMEETLTKSRESLVENNRELEQFAYGCSHDLKEPLRKVSAYTDLLRQNFQNVTDPKAVHYMEYITSGVSRMQQMIADVLAFAEVTRDRVAKEPVDLNVVVQQVLSDIETSVNETHAVVTADPLPTIAAYPFQMRRLFQNLIVNGIKFHGPETPRIHMSAVRQPDGWLFTVQDNGIGIDQAYTDKIFQVFQRLHSREKYDGTGIGLSICKKIVESYGGKIWCESKPGAGALFTFTLP